MAEKALEARRKGENLDSVFGEQREEIKKAEAPRQSVADDIRELRGSMDEAAEKDFAKKNSNPRPGSKKRLFTA